MGRHDPVYTRLVKFSLYFLVFQPIPTSATRFPGPAVTIFELGALRGGGRTRARETIEHRGTARAERTTMASDKRRVALPAAVCVLLLGLAGWRFSSCAEPNLSQPELANAIFNGVNYAALGLIGLGCLFWPGSSGGQDQRAVPVAAPQTSHVGGGGIAYLANLKTFLTVVVVAHHASNQFGGPPIAMPIGTYAYDPRSPIGAAAGTDSFGVFSSALQAVDQMYFMSLFFLVSGIFCPASLDNKGFRAFVLGKILRLGGPLAIFSIILGPATIAWTAHYGGVPVQWVYFAGPCWFILWLLNFSVAYAALATVVPKVVAPKPNPPMLLLLPPLVGLPLSLVFWGISAIPLDAAWGGPSGLGGMVRGRPAGPTVAPRQPPLDADLLLSLSVPPSRSSGATARPSTFLSSSRASLREGATTSASLSACRDGRRGRSGPRPSASSRLSSSAWRSTPSPSLR